MADEIVKKVRIPFEEFPLVQFKTIYNEEKDREEINELFYDFRYRIVSEDKNRFSHWSPIQSKRLPDLAFPNFNYPYIDRMKITTSTAATETAVVATWSPPPEPINPSVTPLTFENSINRKTLYDIWIRWNTSKTLNPDASGWTEWEYIARESSNNFSVLKENPAYQSIDIAIQFPTEVKLRDYNTNKLTLFRQISDTI
jgi:hypothetical protein